MPTTHVRCTDSVHKQLKQIAAREGVSLAQSLEILCSTLPMEGSGSNQDDEILRLFGQTSEPLDASRGNANPTTKGDTAMAEYMSDVMARLEEITSQLDDFCANFGRSDQAEKLNIAEAMRQAFEEQAPLAQQFHQHCSDREHPECAEVTKEAAKTYFKKGNVAATAQFLKLPGVREQWEIHEEVQAAKARGQELIEIIGPLDSL